MENGYYYDWSVGCGQFASLILEMAGLVDRNAPVVESAFYGNMKTGNVFYNRYYFDRGGYMFTDMSKLKPGDVIGFYGSDGWYLHVAIVIRVDKKNGTYVAYDGGSGSIGSRKMYWTGHLNQSPSSEKWGGYYKWYRILRLGSNKLK